MRVTQAIDLVILGYVDDGDHHFASAENERFLQLVANVSFLIDIARATRGPSPREGRPLPKLHARMGLVCDGWANFVEKPFVDRTAIR